MEPEAEPPGDTFVTKGRVRLAEAVRHLVDATLTAEDASSEKLASAAKKVERIATELHGRGEWGTADQAKTGRRLCGDHTEVFGGELVGQILEIGPASGCRPEPPAERSLSGEVEAQRRAERRQAAREIRDEKRPPRSAADGRDHDRSCRAPPGRRESRRDERPQDRWLARP